MTIDIDLDNNRDILDERQDLLDDTQLIALDRYDEALVHYCMMIKGGRVLGLKNPDGTRSVDFRVTDDATMKKDVTKAWENLCFWQLENQKISMMRQQNLVNLFSDKQDQAFAEDDDEEDDPIEVVVVPAN